VQSGLDKGISDLELWPHLKDVYYHHHRITINVLQENKDEIYSSYLDIELGFEYKEEFAH
jgi:hypothetical protein